MRPGPRVLIIPDEELIQKLNWKARYARLLWLTGCGVVAVVVLTLILVSQNRVRRQTPVFLDTRLGTIEGKVIRRYNGVSLVAFTGIPYAEPPIGNLRFKKPVPKSGWHPEILSATKEPDICMQFLLPKTQVVQSRAAHKLMTARQSEDCLYLNVFVPARVTNHTMRHKNKKKAVMVWIHGGAFIVGSAFMSDPSELSLVGDVIVVSIAYRLGIFGFLHSTHRHEAPGNVGLHDQALAIKWVHENIESFGGDRERITLIGESAGGISAGFHMISNHSQSFFKRAILQSGSPLTMSIFGVDSGPLSLEKVAERLSCPYTSRKITGTKYSLFHSRTYECLRDADAQTLRKVERDLMHERKSFGFTPTLDDDFFSNGTHSLEFLKSSNGTFSPFHKNHKQILLGSNGGEGASFLTRVFPSLFPSRSALPSNLSYDAIIQRITRLAPGREKEIKVLFDSAIHEDDKQSPLEIAMKLSHVFRDLAFVCPNLLFMDSFLKAGSQVGDKRTAFLYLFNVRPQKDRRIPWSKSALHTEEIPFVFGYPFTHKSKYAEAERKLSLRIMRYWTNFAKFGHPDGNRNEGQESWPASYDEEGVEFVRWHKVFASDYSEESVSGVPDNQCDHYEPLIEQMRDTYRYKEL